MNVKKDFKSKDALIKRKLKRLREKNNIKTDGKTSQREKPKNAKKLKKLAHQQLLEKTKQDAIINRQNKVEKYLNSFNNDNDNWKFSTVSQAHLTRNIFDRDHIPKSLFQLAIPYLKAIKGNAKARLLSEALEIKKEMELNDFYTNKMSGLKKKYSKPDNSQVTKQNVKTKMKILKAKYKRAKTIVESVDYEEKELEVKLMTPQAIKDEVDDSNSDKAEDNSDKAEDNSDKAEDDNNSSSSSSGSDSDSDSD